MGLKHLAAALLGLAGLARAFVDDETSRSLMSGTLDVNEWIAVDDGYIGGSKHRNGGDKHEFPYGPGVPGTMTDNPPNNATSGMRAYCFEQPVSHFDKSVNGTFCQRYWVAAPNYKPGGPVFLWDAGEGAGDGSASRTNTHFRLAEEHNGIMIVLEHRYYGWSVPVPDFTTDNLRFLNNKEALQDSADFIAHWQPKVGVIPGLVDPKSLSPPNTAWFYYGGSYPGARAAHMRALYPDLVYAAIGSSAVVVAKTHFSGYWDAVHNHGPKACVSAVSDSMKIIDSTLDLGGSAATEIKTLFGCQDLSDADFGDLLSRPIGSWQRRYWIRSDAQNEFIGWFCPAITANGTATTIDNGRIEIPAPLANWAKYVKRTVVAKCHSTMDKCYGSPTDETAHTARTEVTQTWRLWLWQVCTEWGYQPIAYEDGRPSMISKRMTYDRAYKVCTRSFAPGEKIQLPPQPTVEDVNSIGGYTLSRDRLAFINGEADPWREATVHASESPARITSDERPLYLIPGGVHCYDMLQKTNEPQYIKDTHAFLHGFVRKWMDEWKASRPGVSAS